MSSSSAEATVSVVIGSHGPSESLVACLAALEPQRDGAQVLVCEAHASPAELRERFPWAVFLVTPGALVPALWRDGLQRSRGDIVALTIASMQPAGDWIATIREQHRRYDAVAGAIEPGSGLRVSDWAEYFCRYAKDMLPFDAHRCLDLPGDNAAYKRELLERNRELWRDGFWEPVLHRRLAQEAVVLWHSPDLVVRHGRSSGARAFARQRLAHGRAHGNQRGEQFSTARNLLGVAGAPLVPALLTLRIARHVLRRRRLRARALLALPVTLVFNIAWALGEARGHLSALRRP